MAENWTKGPWVSENAGVFAPGPECNRHIIVADCICDEWQRQAPRDQIEANARLIASAPELYEALKTCMVGGNHIASALIGRLGPSFSSDYPPDADCLQVLEKVGSGVNYEMWCCWAAIMRVRAALAKAEAPHGSPQADAK